AVLLVVTVRRALALEVVPLHHAREAESLSQLIFYMWYLLENYNTDPEIAYLVNNLEIYFVPCVNPDGYIYNETTNPNGGGMWRKNRRDNLDGTFGVDLNRNYGYNWGFDNFGSSPTSSSDTYRGPSGFSESETQMMRDFCNAHAFKLAINNHTYSNLLIYPWGYQAGLESPDSLTFRAFAGRLAQCSEFGTGTAIQTVGYTANGNSDDWMYGEQSSKPLILAMTPEAGSVTDGFWPLQSRIVDIAKVTMDQNLSACRLVAAYAEVKSLNDQFITSASGYLNFNIQRLGLDPGNFTVSAVPISATIQSLGGPLSYTSLNLLQAKDDSISYSLMPGINQGDAVQYLFTVSNGSYTVTDTVTRTYGTPVIAFADNCNATTAWTAGGWGISTVQKVSPTGSITDSPSGQYAPNVNKSITTSSFINLTDALAAELSFYAKWDIEQGYDYVEVMASTNGTTFTPLCGKYTGTGNANQDDGMPLYDGQQTSWIKESIDLSAYIGQNIKLRFKLVSDPGTQGDGFYFDDLAVKKIVNPTGIKENNSSQPVLGQNMPNPCYDYTYVNYSVPDKTVNYSVRVFNAMGETLLNEKVNPQLSSVTLNTSGLAAGVYFYQLISGAYHSTAYRMVIVK
ncbi:MAG: M14 family zinc carboxypeptidase, partial [Bacteroidia bacterium]